MHWAVKKLRKMEGELNNFLRLCILTIASLFCCYFIAAKFPKGLLRLLSLFPIITLLSILPFSLNTFHIGFPALAYALGANFKLLFFAFDQGPLSSLPRQDVLCFILVAYFPFKIMTDQKNHSRFVPASPFLEAAVRGVVLAILLSIYGNYKHYFDKHYDILIYFLYTYHEIQFLLALGAIPARLLLGVEVEPQFNSPLFSTSLQDFWGHRWNLRVTDVLRATVYTPIRGSSTCIRIIGDRWASLPSVLVTFIVSGLAHELVYYQMTRQSPTWEVTSFFVLQGVFVDMEIVLKKKLVATNKFRLHRAISGPLALANIAVTANWLFYTQIKRYGIDEKVIKEFNLFLDFIKVKA